MAAYGPGGKFFPRRPVKNPIYANRLTTSAIAATARAIAAFGESQKLAGAVVS